MIWLILLVGLIASAAIAVGVGAVIAFGNRDAPGPPGPPGPQGPSCPVGPPGPVQSEQPPR